MGATDEELIFVCCTRPLLASVPATCSKCGIFCFYTPGAMAYAKKRYAHRKLRLQCERCSAYAMTKETDGQIRESQETARAGMPLHLQPLIDQIEPDWLRGYFRGKVPQ
jgi:hypothetical protein